jgi:glycosyltransferase involved in cell wall biosynthesis
MKQMDFTVAIPTYNGGDRLREVLDRLRSQINSESFSWEILIVDNNSQDNTADVVREYQANWSHSFPLRYCFEDQQGLAFARQKAIDEGQGEFIGFLDDDNLPDRNWVWAAYDFGKAHPRAGAYGGPIYGEFEVEPPPGFERIQAFLAIKEYGSQPHLYEPERLNLPAGAGLVVRKQAWIESVPRRLMRVTRGGNDFEISIHMHNAGWEIWYNPAMQITHKIPKSRLEKEYLLALSRTVGLCICELRTLRAKTWQKPIILTRIMLGSLRRSLRHFIAYRDRVRTDVVAACEMEFHLSSFLSPLHYLKTSIWARSVK